MATKTLTVTATGDWVYIDAIGDPHSITAGETFTFELTDTSATDVTYYIDQGQSVATDDGYTITMRPECDGANTARVIGKFGDTANDGVNSLDIPGEFVCECPKTGIIQRWKVAEMNIDDVDTPTVITTAKFEDQLGNVMTIDSGNTIGIA